MVNSYQSQQFWNDINSVIGLVMSIVVMSFMIGMVRPMGKFIEPPFRPEKHLPKPVARVVTVPGGSHWQCAKCGVELKPGEEAVKIGAKVYCVPCARGGNPDELPHDARLLASEPAWVNEAWLKVSQYMLRQDIRYVTMQEGYQSTLEGRMPVFFEQPSSAIEEWFGFYRKQIAGKIAAFGPPPFDTVRKFRIMLSGYYLIAVGEAPDQVVKDVYQLLKPEVKQYADSIIGPPETEWQTEVLKVYSLFIDGTRADQVIAIDAVIHLSHEYEARPLLMDFYGEHSQLDFTPLAFVARQYFDALMGSQWGMTFLEFVEMKEEYG